MKAGEIKSGKVARWPFIYCIYNNYESDLIVIM